MRGRLVDCQVTAARPPRQIHAMSSGSSSQVAQLQATLLNSSTKRRPHLGKLQYHASPATSCSGRHRQSSCRWHLTASAGDASNGAQSTVSDMPAAASRRSVLLGCPSLLLLLSNPARLALALADVDGAPEETLSSRAPGWLDPAGRTVLVLGGTGRVGGQVLAQLLERGHSVRAVVRSPEKLASEALSNPRLSVIKASVLELSPADMAAHLEGCDAAVSCLGHPLTLGGIYAEPKRLCRDAVALLCDGAAIRDKTNSVVSDDSAAAEGRPLRIVLLSSAGVDNPDGTDAGIRGGPERAFVSALAAALPPYQDNIDAARLLSSSRGVEWSVVRPDDLLEGPPSRYALYGRLNNGLFNAGTSTIANVAALMVELVADDSEWERWRGRMPQVLDAY